MEKRKKEEEEENEVKEKIGMMGDQGEGDMQEDKRREGTWTERKMIEKTDEDEDGN